MLYKFKSKITGDLILLQANGQQILTLIGKGDPDNLVKGILEPRDMPAAVAALEQAIAHDVQASQAVEAAPSSASGPGQESLEDDALVVLRQRAAPMIAMIRRCQAADTPIVWGV